MSKNDSPSKPLLYILQPEFKVKEVKMQQRYSFRVDTVDTAEDTVDRDSVVDEKKEPENVLIEIQEVQTVLHEEAVQEETIPEELKKAEFQAIKEEALAEAVTMKIEENKAESPNERKLNFPETFPASAAEQAPNKTADSQLVQMFLKNMLPQAGGEVIKNIHEGTFEMQQAEIPSRKGMSGQQLESSNSDDGMNGEIKKTVTRLSRYPSFLEKPLCEGNIKGEKLVFQVESKRGDLVKIKIGNTYRQIQLEDILSLKVL